MRLASYCLHLNDKEWHGRTLREGRPLHNITQGMQSKTNVILITDQMEITR